MDENTVLGVDLGISIPAVCSLNNDKYKRLYIGNKENLLKKRVQYQHQRKVLQQRLKMTKGGKGRKAKLKHLDTISKAEKNYVQTYYHMLSKQIIDFAIKNRAKYINLEDLQGFSSVSEGEDFILRNWSYYKLQNYISYKAQLNGLVVRFINPYHTSQICSACGHWEQGQRISQSEFECKKCGYKENADYNASRNIAMSKEK